MSGPFEQLTSEIMYAVADSLDSDGVNKYICIVLTSELNKRGLLDLKEFHQLIQSEDWVYGSGNGVVLNFLDSDYGISTIRSNQFQHEVRFMLCEFIALWLEDEENEAAENIKFYAGLENASYLFTAVTRPE